MSDASDIHLICILRRQVSRGAKFRGEVGKPKTELDHRGRSIKLASYTSGIHTHEIFSKTDQSGSKVTLIYSKRPQNEPKVTQNRPKSNV